MVERAQIVELASRDEQQAGVLVTLVRTDGSSYRRPGARLLTVDGERAGTISGGCLETEVVKRAPWSVRSGAVVERYSTTFDDPADIPYGLGCGGTVDLLLEPAGTLEFRALLEAIERALKGEPSDVITFLPSASAPLRRAVLSGDGDTVFASGALTETEIGNALTGEVQGVFVERLAAPQRLFILGAGDDARPLVQMASLLGWSITVVDARPQLARADRFPQATEVLAMQAGVLSQLGITAQDAVVLMSHSYEQDREWLAAVLPVAPRYLGLLGARHRSSLLVSEASAMTGIPVSECCERIYAPVGLDLGGEGPEAIALSVIAEVQASCMGRLARSRRLSAAEVTRQIAEGLASRGIQTPCALGLSAD
jgi:xanthine/CO dehydrogenase XdhC/CoxF family maturation factor